MRGGTWRRGGTWKIRGPVPLALLVALTGCKTWEAATVAPDRLIVDTRPSSVRVTSVDGVRVTLKNPIVVNDSIVSAVAPRPGAVVIPPRVGFPANDVNLVEVPRVSTGRTISLIGAIAAASIAWAQIQGAGLGSEERPTPLPKDPALNLIGFGRLVWSWF